MKERTLKLESAGQTAASFLLGLAFTFLALVMSTPTASAMDITSESSRRVEGSGYSLEVKTPGERAPLGSTDLNRNIQSSINNAIDQVRETLNLDKSTRSAAKDFADEAERVSDTVNPSEDASKSTQSLNQR